MVEVKEKREVDSDVKVEKSLGSRIGGLEKDVAVLTERLNGTNTVVGQNESRVDKLRISMWKSSGIISIIAMIPIGLAIYNAIAK